MHFLRVSDRFGDIWNNTLKDDAVKAVVADRGKGTYSSRLSFFFFQFYVVFQPRNEILRCECSALMLRTEYNRVEI